MMYLMKTCTKCNLELALEAFSIRRASADGLMTRCKSCCAIYRKENREQIRAYLNQHRERNKERWKEYGRKHDRTKRLKKYGLTEESFTEMAAAQDGKCAICTKVPTDTLVVDHCHNSGVVRGLLCRGCNASLGHFGDDPAILRAALEYLHV